MNVLQWVGLVALLSASALVGLAYLRGALMFLVRREYRVSGRTRP